MRINTAPLPAVTTYDTRTVSTGGYGGSALHTPISHHPSTATPPRWDTTAASYPDSYPSLASHHPSTSQSVYVGVPLQPTGAMVAARRGELGSSEALLSRGCVLPCPVQSPYSKSSPSLRHAVREGHGMMGMEFPELDAIDGEVRRS
ncbi:MedA [Ophiocordyceps sinensis CO18]|uniref:MedA n=1 Tax=Ophiocordyceps sinensis (strain Co18 / CGMCC 3.14243) TaxID=911162 RepID=T5A9E3_OPHSC|nr:MedA [Ophiocordyceps sinensis CO18]